MRNIFFEEPVASATYDVTMGIGDAWELIQGPVIVPFEYISMYICLGMSIILFFERIYMTLVILWVKITRSKKFEQYKLDAVREELERNNYYPMVLVEIPMFNEREVYKLSIVAVCAICAMQWPPSHLIVQVLDDSTNEVLLVLKGPRGRGTLKHQLIDNYDLLILEL